LDLERITCVVEFSSHGTVVLAQALALAKWHDAALDVLLVPRKRRLGRTNTAAAVHAALTDFVAKSNTGRVATSAFVLEGRAIPSMVEHVRNRPAGLVVMGQARPRSWSRRRVATNVARRTGLPVITVPRRASIGSVQTTFRRILCAVDDSIAAAGALQTALRLGQESGGQVIVLHVVENFPYHTVYSASNVPQLLDEFDRHAEGITRHLRALVPRDALHWCDVDYRVVPGLAPTTIASIAAAEGADLVVLGGPPRHWLDLTASTVAGVLARSECAVLTVPGPSGTAPDTGTRWPIADTKPVHVLAQPTAGRAADGSGMVLWSPWDVTRHTGGRGPTTARGERV
jgi:nucleotide-binding universal stress UspA family protein